MARRVVIAPDDRDELRRSLGDEWRAEREAAEHDAATLAARRRVLADIAQDALMRGETLRVHLVGRVVVGRVLYARGDLVTLEAPLGRVDIGLAAVVLCATIGVESPPASAVVPGTATSLRSRLRELELDHPELEVWLTDGTSTSGRLTVVAADHIVLQGPDGRTIVPTGATAAVIMRG